jgi:ribosomal protein S12 methylthiotransferase accessory factor
LTADDARLGALMEAVESAAAEAFAAAPRRAPWSGLPADERAPSLADFAATRRAAPPDDEPLDWVAARRILDGGRLWVPFDAVSLDLARPGDRRLARSSTGQAAHFDREAAVRGALLEAIERDATADWLDLAPTARTETMIEPEGVPYPWFQDLWDRICSADLELGLYQLSPVTPCPGVLAEIVDAARPGGGTLTAYGTACDPDPEAALRGAVLEAVQTRVTEISGARDDIPDAPVGAGSGIGMALPPPSDMPLTAWEDITASAAVTPFEIAEQLAAGGYPQAAIVELSSPASDVVVVKAFVPGLGALRRSRRAPAWSFA